MEEELTVIADLKSEIEKPRVPECSFCGKNEIEVPHLIAGPSSMICSECVELCVDILREHTPDFCTTK